MTLSPGQKLGPYEIISPAGAGGMGEVYKAKDTRLDRIVAIKVLPERTAMNQAMRARFEREAKTISSLNHPNICTLYDIGRENGVDYIVMEYLEGVTIAERVKKGPIPITEALEIASEIADALDKAHRQGLIHRDLKPANVILTKEGAKLLDFGLAKVSVSGGVVEGISGLTQTSPLTGTGTIVGTIQYMAPEQLEGSEADARSDIFAFGGVLYQMITGKRPFDGKSQANMIAAIIERTPAPLTSIVPLTPPGLDRLTRKCLEKNPDKRWQSANDLADELRWLLHSGSQAGLPAPVAAKRKFRLRLGWVIATIAIIIAGYYSFKWHTLSEPAKNLIRFEISPGEQLQSISWPQISPDGRHLAFKATDQNGRGKIWIRSMNSSEAFPLKGTEGAFRQFWSPDSRYLAFSIGLTQLKKVPISGGPAQLIGDFEMIADGSWGSSGMILYDGVATDSISMVSASGGPPVAVTKINGERGETYHSWPEFLPDGEHFLFLSSSDTALYGDSHNLQIGSIYSDERISLFPVSGRVKYCEPGYLVYVKDKTLLAQPFDADKLETTGEPIPIAENISSSFRTSISSFDVSDDGTLVYLTSNVTAMNELVWVDRTGRELSKIMEPARYGDIALSPDGKRLVYGLEDPRTETSDLWMFDLKREVSTRFTFDEKEDWGPVWSPDGATVYFNRGLVPDILPFSKPSNGTGEATQLIDSVDVLAAVTDITQDGSRLCFTTAPNGQPDIEILDLRTDSLMVPVVNTDRDEFLGLFSPDGKYLAYKAEQSDRTELFIIQLDGNGSKWQISTAGARSFDWHPKGGELLYFNLDWEMISVPISTENRENGKETLEIGRSVKLFEHPLSNLKFGAKILDISSDGEKFLLVSAMDQKQTLKINVVLNWPEMLKDQH